MKMLKKILLSKDSLESFLYIIYVPQNDSKESEDGFSANKVRETCKIVVETFISGERGRSSWRLVTYLVWDKASARAGNRTETE